MEEWRRLQMDDYGQTSRITGTPCDQLIEIATPALNQQRWLVPTRMVRYFRVTSFSTNSE